jgi:predicted nucleotidyltransferase
VIPRLKIVEVCAALNAEGAKYLVIGGIACILHGYIRATTDVDILIERSRDNAARVLAALSRTGYGFAREWTADQVLQSPITIIGDDPAIDIFLVAWSVKYDQAAGRSWVAEIDGVSIPVIGLDDLIATKRTGRALDAADIEALEEIRRIRGSG